MENNTVFDFEKIDIPTDPRIIFIIDVIAKIISVTICIPGALLNAALVYLILVCTPNSMRSYSIFLLNFAVFDLATSIIGFFACQKVIFSGFSLIYIFLGPCRFISPVFCYFCHCFQCHTLAHSQWILLASFVYRYRILLGNHPNRRQMMLISLGLYSMSLTFLVFYLTDVGDSDELLDIVDQLHPEYHYKNTEIWGEVTVSGNVSFLSVISFLAILYMTIPCFPIYIAVLWFRRETLLMLNSPTINISPALKSSHRKLVQALTAQALIPIFWLIASFVYSSAEVGLISGPIVENTPFRLMDCIPLTSPIVTIVFISPYSEGLFHMAKQAKSKLSLPSYLGNSAVEQNQPAQSGVLSENQTALATSAMSLQSFSNII